MPAADSSARMPSWPADSAGYAWSIGFPAGTAAGADNTDVPAGFREATPEEVFGPGSRPGAEATQGMALGGDATAHPLSGSPVFQVSVLLLAVGYCAVYYYFRSSLMELVKMVRGKLYTAKLLEDANYVFALFLNMAFGLGLLASAIGIVRMVEIMFPGAGAGPQWMADAAVPATLLGLLLVTGYRIVVIRLAGNLTMSGEFGRRLWFMRKMATVLGMTLLIPVLLLWALNTGGTQIAMTVLVAGTWLFAAGFTQYKTYVLFAGQNFSILHWILYLCAVEIFPVSLVVALAFRNVW